MNYWTKSLKKLIGLFYEFCFEETELEYYAESRNLEVY